MSDAARLIEKFGLAIHGEEPSIVISVLVAFVRTCCEHWQLDPAQFAAAVVSPDMTLDEPVPPS